MLLRKPTKTTLKMEDDFRDYEEHKQKLLQEDFKSKTSLNMNPTAFRTPRSQKIEREGLDMLQESNQELRTYLTPRRHHEPDSSHEEERTHRSNEYLNNLLNNILPEKRRDS